MRKNGAGGFAEHRGHRGDASGDLLLGLGKRHLVKPQRMALAVRADRVASRHDLADQVGMVRRHLADKEEGRFNAFVGQRVEDMICASRQRTVVEREHDLSIFERQAFVVLRATQPGVIEGIHDDGANGPDCVQIPRALGGSGGTGRQQRCRQNSTFQSLPF
jgi:hypothetical protein